MIRANTLCVLVVSVAFLLSIACAQGQAVTSDQLPTAGPPGTLGPDYAGQGGIQVAASVVRVGCNKSAGTGFVHKSGWIVTAAHVVLPCGDTARVQTANGQSFSVKAIRRDDLLDLAILSTELKIETGTALPLSSKTLFAIGSKVSTWGFPSGYSGYMPLLTVGYLAGVGPVKNEFGVTPPQWVVNGAFNLGNSGGPVISIEDGSVIGVVSSKLAVIPPGLEGALKALRTNRNGIQYPFKHPDGRVEEFSEAQIVGEILHYLRSQTQLVIGHAVSVKELRQFLEKQGIEP